MPRPHQSRSRGDTNDIPTAVSSEWKVRLVWQGPSPDLVAFELENGFQHGLTMDERTVLLQDSLLDDFQGIVGPIDIDLLVKHPLQPVLFPTGAP